MGSEWQTMSLQEAEVQLLDCVHKTPVAKEEGYPYVAIPQIKDGRIDLDSVRLISVSDYLVWTKKTHPKLWDIVLSRRCNPGTTAHVPRGLEFALGQNLVLLRSNGRYIFPAFLRWLTKSPFWWEEVKKYLNVGAVFDSLRCADIPHFRFPIPPIREQRAIAHILGSLDDKIELNRKMNETLEAIVRAIFKSWFVDFDPVRAKAEGRDPGLPKEIADPFPDSFEDSELGQIPKGWKVKPIGKAVRCVGGSTPSTKNPEFWNGGTNPFVTPKDMSSLSSPVLLETTRHISDAGVEKISSGRLPAGAVLLSSRAPIGYLAITETPVSVNQGIIAMICDKELPNYYVLYWTETYMDTIKSNAGGTTFAEISKSNFRPIQVIVPHESVLEAYVQQVEPLYQQLILNLQESNSLASLRDSLLPKLISGELCVPDAKKFIEKGGV